MALNRLGTIIKIQTIIILHLIILLSSIPIQADEADVTNISSQEVSSGTYELISDGDNTIKQLIYNEEGSSTLVLYLTFDQDLIITLSFTRDFPGFKQIEESNLLLGSIPVTISSSGFKQHYIPSRSAQFP